MLEIAQPQLGHRTRTTRGKSERGEDRHVTQADDQRLDDFIFSAELPLAIDIESGKPIEMLDEDVAAKLRAGVDDGVS